jgi:hypothetical protein
MQKVERIVKNYINDNDLSLNDDISDIIVEKCKYSIASVLEVSVKTSRNWILICIEGLKAQAYVKRLTLHATL